MLPESLFYVESYHHMQQHMNMLYINRQKNSKRFIGLLQRLNVGAAYHMASTTAIIQFLPHAEEQVRVYHCDGSSNPLFQLWQISWP